MTHCQVGFNKKVCSHLNAYIIKLWGCNLEYVKGAVEYVQDFRRKITLVDAVDTGASLPISCNQFSDLQ